MKILVRLFINAFALWSASYLVNGITLSDKTFEILFVAGLFAVVNTFIKPVLQLFALPVILLSLGLFTIVLNALMLMLTAYLTEFLVVTHFWPALWGALIISLVSTVLGSVFRDDIK